MIEGTTLTFRVRTAEQAAMLITVYEALIEPGRLYGDLSREWLPRAIEELAQQLGDPDERRAHPLVYGTLILAEWEQTYAKLLEEPQAVIDLAERRVVALLRALRGEGHGDD